MANGLACVIRASAPACSIWKLGIQDFNNYVNTDSRKLISEYLIINENYSAQEELFLQKGCMNQLIMSNGLVIQANPQSFFEVTYATEAPAEYSSPQPRIWMRIKFKNKIEFFFEELVQISEDKIDSHRQILESLGLIEVQSSF
jgi:hypothetical protein